jgi:hypothetical protein
MTIHTHYFFYGVWISFEEVLEMIEDHHEYLKVKELNDEDVMYEYLNDLFGRDKGFETNRTEYDGVKLYIRKPTHDNSHSEENDNMYIFGIYLGSYDLRDNTAEELAVILNEIYFKTIPKYEMCSSRKLIIATDDCKCCS